MKSPQHFALSFLAPLLTGVLYCGVVGLIWEWLDRHGIQPLVTMLVGAVLAAMATRWFLRNCVAVSCPFCGGRSYEIPEKGNRFMCRVCGKDH